MARAHGSRGHRAGVLRLLAAVLVAGAVLPACSSAARTAGPTTPADPETAPAPTTTSPTGSTGPARPGTLPPGSALPTDDDCAARIVPAAETRPANQAFNATKGQQKHIPEPWLDRVTGAYTGTTDEILQWGACKWGIDPDIVRAQAAKESYWNMQTYGDFGADPAACPAGHAIGVDGKRDQCPQSIGILQIRYPYHGPPAGRATWPEAAASTAYNVDYTYALWRSCYEGDLTWLNTTERRGTYAAGDAWGCLGVWFSGRWHTEPADAYIDAVRSYDDQQVWLTNSFRTAH